MLREVEEPNGNPCIYYIIYPPRVGNRRGLLEKGIQLPVYPLAKWHGDKNLVHPMQLFRQGQASKLGDLRREIPGKSWARRSPGGCNDSLSPDEDLVQHLTQGTCRAQLTRHH